MSNTMTKVRNANTGIEFEIDELSSLSDIERKCPAFFLFRFTHGKRETYSVYRGFLIVRSTVKFTREKPKRRTVLYLYGRTLGENHGPDTFHITSDLSSVRQAHRCVDRIIQKGEYNFDEQP